MPQPFLALRPATEATAATGNDLAFVFADGGPAHRAFVRHLDGPGIRRPLRLDHLHHLRDDVASAVDEHGIADAQIESRNLVHVVQRRVGDGDPANEYRLELGDRRDGTRSADLEVDIHEHGARLLRGVFVGDGPTRLAGHLAQPLAQ